MTLSAPFRRGNRRVVFQTEHFGKKPDDCTVVIRFVGLFDTVGSFGIPGNSINLGIRMDLPPSVLNAAHATSLDEKKYLFPPTPLNPPALGQNFVEKGFRGDHSDVGGRKNDGNNDLTRATLEWMWAQGVQVGVPFGPLPAYTPSGRTTPNDDTTRFPWNLFPPRPR